MNLAASRAQASTFFGKPKSASDLGSHFLISLNLQCSSSQPGTAGENMTNAYCIILQEDSVEVRVIALATTK
jgi:hypothetical protein